MSHKTQTRSTAATESNNQVSNANANAPKQEAHARVVETRERWQVIFDHAVSLVVTLAKGEKLPEHPEKGFQWGKVAIEPNSRFYAKHLLAGFLTGKAGKVLANNELLAECANRQKIVSQVLLSTKLVKGKDAIAPTLAKTEPKQAKTFAEAVLKGLSQQEAKA